jgi:aspartokinase-like uncharacterized kinase
MSKKSKNPESLTPLVMKFGGSLYERVPDLVPVLRRSSRPLFIVPGGGRYADEVRAASLPDDEAHWMAVRAMDKYGEYIGSCGLATTKLLRVPDKTMVFLPYRCTQHYDPLPHSWDITSDTIAAWVANELGLDLLILKSVDGIRLNDTLVDSIGEAILTDVVDPCCISYILNHGVRATIMNGSRADIVARFLHGEPVPCTRIGTTF